VILEVHGDVCRLGYLKVVACLLEDGVPRSPDYLSSLLLETSKTAENDAVEQLGLLRTEVNATNYVKLASELGFYDKSTGGLGPFGAAYICMNSASHLKKHITGEDTALLSRILALGESEKILLLHALLSKDFHMISNILLWAAKTREFTRQQAMEVIMEEIYPEALRRVAKKLTDRRRQLVLKELESAARFREERLGYSKVEWIRSRLYAKYRHTVPPRLEWLSDLGLLDKPRRGKYMVSKILMKNFRELEIVLNKPVERLDQSFFSYFVQSVLPLRSAGRQVEAQFLTEAYRVLSKAVHKVRLDVLCLATAYRMIDAGYRSTPATVSQTFSYLSFLYSDRVFANYSEDGSPEVSGLDIELSEMNE